MNPPDTRSQMSGAGSSDVPGVLLLGGGGQVGLALAAHDWPQAVRLRVPSRAQADFAEPAALAAYLVENLAAGRGDIVVNAAAYTAVDRAEAEVADAWAVNALAPAVIAAETARLGVPLIHLSTDYVFDGSKDTPYVETDAVGPRSVYGASKEGGEQAVRTANPRHVIVRTAWVYGPHRANFVKTMLRVGGERDSLSVVDDQIGCPTSTADIATAIAIIVGAITDGRTDWGTYHLAGTGETSWFGFASAIFDGVRARGGRAPALHPIETSGYPTPARRPANSRLDCTRFERVFGFRARPWEDALADTLDTLLPIEKSEKRPS